MTSKLVEMQSRLQQRQLQEKENKLLSMYEKQQQRTIDRVNRSSAGSTTSGDTLESNNVRVIGKVRQMFEERRNKTEPNTTNKNKILPMAKPKAVRAPPAVKYTDKSKDLADSFNTQLHIRNGSSSQHSKLQKSDSPSKNKISTTLKQNSNSLPTHGDHIMTSVTFASQAESMTTKKPVATGSKAPAPGPTREDLVECRTCKRRFTSDRIALHETICDKTARKKRKVYDATKHRLEGTELAPFARRATKPRSTPTKQRHPVANAPAGNKKDWRKTHEEFIAAIRAAKMAQAYVAKGGNVADLPPPPPSSNPDYVECPHCHRRFNQSAAERHIPKCATYDFNKPKPGAIKPVKSRPSNR